MISLDFLLQSDALARCFTIFFSTVSTLGTTVGFVVAGSVAHGSRQSTAQHSIAQHSVASHSRAQHSINIATPDRRHRPQGLRYISAGPLVGLQAARDLLYSVYLVVLLVLLACYLLACLLTSLVFCSLAVCCLVEYQPANHHSSVHWAGALDPVAISQASQATPLRCKSPS